MRLHLRHQRLPLVHVANVEQLLNEQIAEGFARQLRCFGQRRCEARLYVPHARLRQPGQKEVATQLVPREIEDIRQDLDQRVLERGVLLAQLCQQHAAAGAEVLPDNRKGPIVGRGDERRVRLAPHAPVRLLAALLPAGLLGLRTYGGKPSAKAQVELGVRAQRGREATHASVYRGHHRYSRVHPAGRVDRVRAPVRGRRRCKRRWIQIHAVRVGAGGVKSPIDLSCWSSLLLPRLTMRCRPCRPREVRL
mmetsp:Transcript_15978/g.43829  ORF Transcript_15978/g.43829 Transcript_15978/m.43829 type:complete len:250 (-) Transcript_15978:208-957(-)